MLRISLGVFIPQFGSNIMIQACTLTSCVPRSQPMDVSDAILRGLSGVDLGLQTIGERGFIPRLESPIGSLLTGESFSVLLCREQVLFPSDPAA